MSFSHIFLCFSSNYVLFQSISFLKILLMPRLEQRESEKRRSFRWLTKLYLQQNVLILIPTHMIFNLPLRKKRKYKVVWCRSVKQTWHLSSHFEVGGIKGSLLKTKDAFLSDILYLKTSQVYLMLQKQNYTFVSAHVAWKQNIMILENKKKHFKSPVVLKDFFIYTFRTFPLVTQARHK